MANQGSHVGQGNPGVRGELSGEGMVVGGKQQPAVHLAADVLQHGMGDGVPIKGAGATAQLIQHHQTVLSGMLQPGTRHNLLRNNCRCIQEGTTCSKASNQVLLHPGKHNLLRNKQAGVAASHC